MSLVLSGVLSASMVQGVQAGNVQAAAGSEATGQQDQGLVWPVVADPNVDPIVFAVTQQFKDEENTRRWNDEDVAAMAAFYNSRQDAPLWVSADGFTDRALAARREIASAEDWGLEASDYQMPPAPVPGSSTEDLATIERQLGLEILKFARHARSGRVDPTSVTRINDFPSSAIPPKSVLADLAQRSDIAIYLRDLHPKHPEFERLRQALLKARGGSDRDVTSEDNGTKTKGAALETGALPKTDEKATPTDEAQQRLPSGETLTQGSQHEDIAALRKHLSVPADVGANSHYFDAPLVEALEAFQRQAGLVPTGNLDAETRKRLNTALLKPDTPDAKSDSDRDTPPATRIDRRKVQLILNNMERWRWLPHDMGEFYVWNNVPEFRVRVFKGQKTVFSERIVVGLPSWATPSFMADMKYVIFHPSWGMPNGIKVKELLPRLKQAQPQSLFDFFSGGGGSASVLRAYNLTVYRNGRQIDPGSVNWNSANIRSYSFVQPPGGSNPLGIVKFRFPNKHNVYMHDTIEPELFSKSSRAYSHGCIRVRNPIKLAAVLLGHDKGVTSDAVRGMLRSGRSVELDDEIPVYVTYMTARVDDKGRLQTYGDIYGRDSRLARQLGRSMRFEQPKVATPKTSSAPRTRSAQKKRKKKKSAAHKKSHVQSSVRQAISGQY